MLPATTRQITTHLAADGWLTARVEDAPLPAPAASQVVVQVEAAPINPSDLGLLFGPADVEAGEFTPGMVRARMGDGALRAFAARVGMTLPVGNEGAGTVIAAGSDAAAQALVGRRVAAFVGGMYAQHRVIEAADCLLLPDDVSAREGAAAFVNPLTALAFVETMHAEGHKALIHTAAASNLGQMLHRICAEDGIPLVNVVRKPEQAELLRGLGAAHVVDSSAPTFRDDLVSAITATGATMAFDAVGGGTLLGQIMGAMEKAANSGGSFARYGSNSPKRGFIYGTLDPSPTVLNRNFGYVWDISGFLLAPMMEKLGAVARQRMHTRVARSLKTTFANHYKADVTLEAMLTREAVLDYNARATGAKYLVTPQG
ncbi:NADH oxidase [Novosphingobium sp. FSY-8]|uniref:NADH oxidase n=1 Tax=Novosphingobium ovatum TaxID=1908523 RepID=A0ABW9XHZ7_9SPHN|nr:zinc-binding dehydrogenase [Novosphingobium ovatum]NBC38074.1 NADH oxidase [Novosphingobium ovatum]